MEKSKENRNLLSLMWKYSVWILSLSFVGLLLSLYALYVEIMGEENVDYEALCDINEHISCSKVFLSEYGRGFGIVGQLFGDESQLNQPNSIYGAIFYILIGIFSFSSNLVIVKMQVILAAGSNLLSIYLAYLLYFVLEDFCVICVSNYVVNILLVIVANNRYKVLSKVCEIKRKSKKIK